MPLPSIGVVNIFPHKKVREALLISLLFFLIAFPVMSLHELWRDEIQAWSIAYNSHTVMDIWHNSRYEGHPKLWFLLLFLVKAISANIFYMQLLHLVIASLTVFIFHFFSPFHWSINILTCSGYFFAYEYAIISRNYAIEVLLLFTTAGIYINYASKAFLQVALLIFLLFQTNVYAVITGLLFFLYISYELYILKNFRDRKYLAGIVIVLAGSILSVISIKPPSNGGFATGWCTQINLESILRSINIIERSFYPLPLLKTEFWNSNFLDAFPESSYVKLVVSIITLLLAGLLFSDNKKVLLLFFSGVFALLTFSLIKYHGYLRHHGHVFLVFILCCWLYFDDKKMHPPAVIPRNSFLFFSKKYFLGMVLIVQLMATGCAVFYDLHYPFSNAEHVKQYLIAQQLDQKTILGDKDVAASAVSGLLQKKFYYPSSDSYGTYLLWNTDRKELSDSAVVACSEKISKNANDSIVAVLSYLIKPQPANWNLLNSFESAIVGDENYFIYLISPLK